jgi:hypothetical protein
MRARRRYRRRGSFGRLALATLMVIASGVGFLVTSAFTASNTVPATFISSSTRAIGANDLKPAGCNSLTLTTVVTVTGNFSNAVSNALVLGDSGNGNGTDSTGSSCIIAGGGNDHITATTGDFCQIGPAPGSHYTNCSTF